MRGKDMDVPKKVSRRSFLLGAGVGSAAAVAAIGSKMTPRSAVPAKPSEPVRQRISEHVRKYYRTTRI
jgi:hypothetical protein